LLIDEGSSASLKSLVYSFNDLQPNLTEQ